MSHPEPALELKQVWKRFVVRHNRVESLKDMAISLVDRRRRESREIFWALKGINLRVEKGETVGVIGPNGAGKSTLLRIAAKILSPDKGELIVRGLAAPIIELGIGFEDQLTGLENFYLATSLYGLSRADADQILSRVVEFSGLEDFIDVPLKNYSSGMKARLGFSIVVHLQADILLVDEVLAVGDSAFQVKCLTKMQELQQQGISILLVAHDLGVIRRLCRRVAVLTAGEIDYLGDPGEAIERYQTQSGTSSQSAQT